jgi:hypothetical protein
MSEENPLHRVSVGTQITPPAAHPCSHCSASRPLPGPVHPNLLCRHQLTLLSGPRTVCPGLVARPTDRHSPASSPTGTGRLPRGRRPIRSVRDRRCDVTRRCCPAHTATPHYAASQARARPREANRFHAGKRREQQCCWVGQPVVARSSGSGSGGASGRDFHKASFGAGSTGRSGLIWCRGEWERTSPGETDGKHHAELGWCGSRMDQRRDRYRFSFGPIGNHPDPAFCSSTTLVLSLGPDSSSPPSQPQSLLNPPLAAHGHPLQTSR